jgi:ribosomal protein S18 acetylase RimI-like enzyme
LTDTINSVQEHRLGDNIRLLRADEVGKVRQTWEARHSHADLRSLVSSPDWHVLWNTHTGEYVVAGPWRHRSEVLEVVDISAVGGAVELVQELSRFASTLDQVELILVPERAERRKEQFYASVGFEAIEEIIIYELHNLRPPRHRPLTPVFQAVDITDPAQLREIVDLDHEAFPWLWWNSEGEFRNYAEAPGVQIELARDRSGRPLAYVGYTRLRSWGHLDRIAVDPSGQGRGLGRSSLEYAVARMVSTGARRVGLSTQANNHVSRALYESFGFQRNRAHDYRLFGRWIDRHQAE